MAEPRLTRGRLAPSPTGRLHLGHARTFLLAWLSARSQGGELLLRMEDLDQSRSRPELADGIVRDLEWLGLDWDGPVTAQSSRLEPLSAAAARLHERGFAYRCVCTRADLRSAVSAPQRGVEEPRYPGTCRDKTPVELGQRPSALRFRVPPGPISFVDGIAGPQSVDVASDVGDFMIQNRAGIPSYQLAVVVDDDLQGVTEVFRGDDLLTSTARQRLLLGALGLPEPTWYHAPLVLDASGRRLAKRADDLSLSTLRGAGVDARAVVAWALGSAGLEAEERVTPREWISRFDVGRLRREPALLSDQTLAALFAAH
jgi:glutamyl-tRNA synthetase